MTFQTPAWLGLLVLVAALIGGYVLQQLRRPAYAARFTNVSLLASLLPKRPGWRRHAAFGLVALALAALVVSLGTPSALARVPRQRATVMMALDVSLSMRATDITPTRFRAMQAAAKHFVDLVPPGVNLGLVSFSGTPTTLATPTTDHAQVATAIDHLQLAESTAIGEAIYACLTDIATFQSGLGTTSTPPPAEIVLLSDGFTTVGRSNDQAVVAAKAAHVPVSTIAFGTDYGALTLDGQTVPVPVDRAALKKIADDSGGSFHAAASAQDVDTAYTQLGRQVGYTTQPKDISPWFVRAGVLLALLGTTLSMAWTNRLL
jgi:Ca-activated chloride channel family protein